MQYIHAHTEGYYSAIKKEEIQLFSTTWIYIEDIMLRKIN